MISEINQIKEWFHKNVGKNVPDGRYEIPIYKSKFYVDIENDKIYIRSKVPLMKVSRIRDVKLPERANDRDAGIDFFVPNDQEPIFLQHGESALIPSGIKANVPSGYMLAAHNKSGIGSKMNLDRLAEVVDETYQGEIHINVINNGREVQTIKPGMKILQFILIPVNYSRVEEVPIEELYEEITTRGEGGFGSTDNKGDE
jgi:dUTP pyrophosphatase